MLTDGAVNIYRDYYDKIEKNNIDRGPDYVVGDMDSIDSESLDWLNNKVD